MNIAHHLSQTLSVNIHAIERTIELLDTGATVPFIARYRKEVTGGLDDTILRELASQLIYFKELDLRRTSILKSIKEQGHLTDAIKDHIEKINNKTELEDAYLPYKPKRRTKAQIAKEQGLEPLALTLLEHRQTEPEKAAQAYISTETGILDSKAALDGARAILIERFAHEASLIGQLREMLWQTGSLLSLLIDDSKENASKFQDYFDYKEALIKLPSHRILALFRGRNEGVIKLSMAYIDSNLPKHQHSHFENLIAQTFHIKNDHRAADAWLMDTVRLSWRGKIFPSLETELFTRLKTLADTQAITVFDKNLKDVLLAPPAGHQTTMGLDPGIRTGVKVAVVDETGRLLATQTIYPHAPRNDWSGSLATLKQLVLKHHVTLIAIGNGTASRETDKLITDLLAECPDTQAQKMMVSEAGASIYSASAYAAQEFPDLDVTLRGAVSIARRLQDPLAELVKIEPKSIGVGQYQHDVNQHQLAQSLDAVVEDCVHAVGVDLNTASVALLNRVSGISPTLAENIVNYRDKNGAFKNRKALFNIPRLGEKAFEHAAGFLRIHNGEEPLDASSVHPEAYHIVKKMLIDLDRNIQDVMGNNALIQTIQAKNYTDERFGLPTVMDILSELQKPGRDPRGSFHSLSFSEQVHSITDLTPGMTLDGIVSNVANFGAFVDIGVHQDGLVHISALANHYVKDPMSVVKIGDIVRVRVMEVDVKRKRISLSMKSSDKETDSPKATSSTHKKNHATHKKIADAPKTQMTEAFLKLKNKH